LLCVPVRSVVASCVRVSFTEDQRQIAYLLKECVMVRDGLAKLSHCFTAVMCLILLVICLYMLIVSLSLSLSISLYLYFEYDVYNKINNNNNDYSIAVVIIVLF